MTRLTYFERCTHEDAIPDHSAFQCGVAVGLWWLPCQLLCSSYHPSEPRRARDKSRRFGREYVSFYIFAACLAIEFCRDPSRREERVRDEIVDRQTEDPRWLCFPDCYSLVYWRRRSLHTLKVVEVGAVQEAAAVRVEVRPQAAQLLGQPRLARRVVRLQGALARQAPQALDPREQALKRSVASQMAPPILEVTTIPVMIQAAPGTQAKCPPRLEPIASERQTRAEDHLAATRQQVPVPKLPVRRSIELAGKAAAVLTVRSRKAPKCPATLQFERKIRSSIRKSKASARDVDRASVVSGAKAAERQ